MIIVQHREEEMKRAVFMTLAVLILASLDPAFCAETVVNPKDIPRMTVRELQAKLAGPDLVIIDVRSAHDWDDSSVKIKGAVREEAYRIGSWVNKYPRNKTIVLYCK
jgi:hypothetical protein